ncbi:hypothetical protein SteCoe_6883 [Stentor coeruleus]|uniref:C3H1-type domain-containing protein n=1 Tax=Stentor coeruleus TaxID=5963 RepID=A0A1R2CNX9_9CILI|nr:hypothetical protein SteCoe_6883 [Stentor coeruleus]
MQSDLEDGELPEEPIIPIKRKRENTAKIENVAKFEKFQRVEKIERVEKFVKVDKIREKTVKCKFWENGACTKGNDCKYLHAGDINIKNELCKYFLTSCCLKGDLCGYSHDTTKFPCKYFHGVGVCNAGNECKFSHVRLTPEEIPKFIQENEVYLMQVQKYKGTTNLGNIFNVYLRHKEFEKSLKADNDEKKTRTEGQRDYLGEKFSAY